MALYHTAVHAQSANSWCGENKSVCSELFLFFADTNLTGSIPVNFLELLEDLQSLDLSNNEVHTWCLCCSPSGLHIMRYAQQVVLQGACKQDAASA